MTLARFIPDEADARYGEDVEIVGPAGGTATGLAFVVHGVESGSFYLAWADELTLVAEPAEVLR